MIINLINSKTVEQAIKNKVVFSSNNCGNFIVVGYTNNKNVTIKFIDTDYINTVCLNNITTGRVKDKFKATLYGVGMIGDKYLTKVGRKHTREYTVWSKMLERCYHENSILENPSYVDCSVSDNFKDFTYFHEWCNEQIGFNTYDDKNKSFEIDKDLLVKGNKLYSENTCIFLPKDVNVALTKSDRTRGDNVIGVNFHKASNKFQARFRKGNKSIYLGIYNTETEAFNAYKQAKESYLKHLAEKWKTQIDPRAYEALMNYEVEITD